MSRRFLNLIRIVFATAGRSAFQRAAPLYFAILVAASIIFSKHGMDARDVTEHMQRSLALRLSLWGLWLLATTPAARAVLREPALFYLRSLPVPRAHYYVAHGLLLILVESPWIALHARGTSAVAALCIGVAAMAAHTLIVAQPRRIHELAAAATLILLVVHPISPSLFLAASIVALAIGMVAAWVRAPLNNVGTSRPLLRGPALIALTLAYLLTLWRSHAALLLRLFLLALLGSAIATLTVLNNELNTAELRSTLTMGALAAPLLLGACGLAGPVLRSERQARWLLESCGTSGASRVISTSLAVSLWTALFAALGAILTGWLLGGSPTLLLRLLLFTTSEAALLGIISCCCVRWALRGNKQDGDRVLLVMILLSICVALFTWLLHEMVLGFWLVIALATLDRAIRSTNPRGRWLRLRQERREQQGEAL